MSFSPRWAPFLSVFSGSCPEFQVFCKHFHRFYPDFPGFCPNFQRFFPDFRQTKTFGGALAPLALSPPTPLLGGTQGERRHSINNLQGLVYKQSRIFISFAMRECVKACSASGEEVQQAILRDFGLDSSYWQASKMFWQTIQHLLGKRVNTSKSIKNHNGVLSKQAYTVTDLRICQTGHGQGPRATPSYDDLLSTQNLRNCAEA